MCLLYLSLSLQSLLLLPEPLHLQWSQWLRIRQSRALASVLHDRVNSLHGLLFNTGILLLRLLLLLVWLELLLADKNEFIYLLLVLYECGHVFLDIGQFQDLVNCYPLFLILYEQFPYFKSKTTLRCCLVTLSIVRVLASHLQSVSSLLDLIGLMLGMDTILYADKYVQCAHLINHAA